MEKSEVKDKKKSFISIGFKLISIISIIIIISLLTMMVIATIYFTSDKEVNLNENNLKIADVISQKVSSDFLYLQEKGNFIASTLLKVRNMRNFQKVQIANLLFKKDKDLIFIGLAEQGKNNSIILKDYTLNIAITNKNKISDIDIKSIIKKESKQYMQCFLNESVVHNSSPHFKKPVIGVGIPYEIINNNNAKSFIIIYIKMDRFIDVVKSYDIFKSFIVNREGEIIAHNDPLMAISKASLSKLEIVTKMKESPSDNGQMPFKDENGIEYLGAFKKINFAQIGVVTTVKKDVAFAAVNRILKINILITIIVLTSAIFIVYFFAKTLTNPVKRLVDATTRIEEGKFNVEIHAAASDEIGLLTESFKSMAQGLSEREKMKEAFGKFVNKEIAEKVLKDEIKLGGEKKNAAVFFSDIRSFTAMSEKLEPEKVVEFLNEYMTKMVACVNSTDGIVDKFIGDAIMALWGTPVSKGNDTENAVNSALMMRKVLYNYNKERENDNKHPIRIGMGINTGPVLAGQIGSHDRMEYTVIGDTVNLASRIESLNKPFGTDILITEDSYNMVKDIYNVVPMKKIMVKGKEEPQQIFAVLDRKDNANGVESLTVLRKIIGIDENINDKSEIETKETKYEIID